MSEEIEAGAAAPASEAAEVAPEAVSAESAPAEAADTGVAEDSSDLSLSDASDESEAAPVSFPSADEFGWDDWDGTHDALPEPVRGWGSRLSTHYSSAADTKIKEQQESSEYTQRLYDALMSGDEDPRISEYSTKIADWETKFGTLDDKHSTMSTEYEEFKASVNAAIEQEAEEYANSFRETNSDLFSDEKLAETFADLLEEGWDLETAAEAFRLLFLRLQKRPRPMGCLIPMRLNSHRGPEAPLQSLVLVPSLQPGLQPRVVLQNRLSCKTQRRCP